MGVRVGGTQGGVRLGAVYAAHAASHGFVLVLPAVLVSFRAEFGASFTTLGVVATVSTMLYGLGALPTGLLADLEALRWFPLPPSCLEDTPESAVPAALAV
jgi:hypothetical protein